MRWHHVHWLRLLLLAGLGLFTACSLWEIGSERNVTRHGLPFTRYKLEADSTRLGILARNTEIEGYPCQEGFIAFHPNWRLMEFRLAAPVPFADLQLPERTWLFADSLGRVHSCIFPENLVIQGHRVRGGAGGLEGVVTGFHPDRSLRSFFSREDVDIDGIPCRGSVFHSIELFPDGRLAACTLARAHELQGRGYRAGTRLRFTTDDRVRQSD